MSLAFSYFEYTSKNSNVMFNFMRNHHVIFCTSYTSVYSHQESIKGSIFSTSFPRFIYCYTFILFVILIILIGSEHIFSKSLSHTNISLSQNYRNGNESNIFLNKGLFYCIKTLTVIIKYVTLTSLATCLQLRK